MQWIKVFTNIFANPKMQLLLKERDGDMFFRVWIQLLVIAGLSMQSGKIMMSEKYTNDSRRSCNNYTQIIQKNSKYIGQVNPF